MQGEHGSRREFIKSGSRGGAAYWENARALLRNEPGLRWPHSIAWRIAASWPVPVARAYAIICYARRPRWLGELERELFRGKRADNTNQASLA